MPAKQSPPGTGPTASQATTLPSPRKPASKITQNFALRRKKYKVSAIGTKAFDKLKSLKKVTIKSDDLNAIGKKAVKAKNGKITVTVPKKSVAKYKKLLKKAGLKKFVKVKGE